MFYLNRLRDGFELFDDSQVDPAFHRVERIRLSNKKNTAESEFTQAVREVQALKRQPSNIPANMLELRRNIAEASPSCQNGSSRTRPGCARPG